MPTLSQKKFIEIFEKVLKKYKKKLQPHQLLSQVEEDIMRGDCPFKEIICDSHNKELRCRGYIHKCGIPTSRISCPEGKDYLKASRFYDKWVAQDDNNDIRTLLLKSAYKVLGEKKKAVKKAKK